MALDQARPVGLGTMRLAALAGAGVADDAHPGLGVLLAAIDAGVTLVDAADVYGAGPDDVGRAERLVAAARARRPAAALTVVTKGGLVRHGDHYHPRGTARHLEAAAAASRARLGAIDLYLLHVVDPKVPLATSVRALDRVRQRGVAAAIGLANVGRAQLDEALAVAPIAAVQVELSPWRIDPVRGGLVARCAELGIPVLAHRPLGGPAGARRLARERLLIELAAALGATPHELALAWLRALAPGIVPLPGPGRVETAASAARAAALALPDDARAALDARFLGEAAGAPPRLPRDGEVVIVMGMPGAGKSTLAEAWVERGYVRLNRDAQGGTLARLARRLDDALAAGTTRAVLDNTYPTRASRAAVIAAARRHGLPVRCVWLDTPVEDAQVNAAARLLDRHGALLEPDALARAARRDPGAFAPGVQFRWRRELEPPSPDEGLAAIEVVRFARRPPAAGGRPALIVELDDVVRVGRPVAPAAVELVPGAAAALAAWRAAGWAVVATSWAPALAAGADPEAVAAAFARTAELAGGLPAAWCAHPAGPPRCWCRKPLPGLGLALARAHGLALARSVHVGRGAADRGFAARLGARFVDADAWLAGAPPPGAAVT